MHLSASPKRKAKKRDAHIASLFLQVFDAIYVANK
jgi:hypothetical protein